MQRPADFKIGALAELMDPHEIVDGDTWGSTREVHFAMRVLASELALTALREQPHGGHESPGAQEPWTAAEFAAFVVEHIAVVAGTWWWVVPAERAVELAADAIERFDLTRHDPMEMVGEAVDAVLGTPTCPPLELPSA